MNNPAIRQHQNIKENESNIREDLKPAALPMAFSLSVIKGEGNHHPMGKAKTPGINGIGQPPIKNEPGKVNILAKAFPDFGVTLHKGAIMKLQAIKQTIGIIIAVTMMGERKEFVNDTMSSNAMGNATFIDTGGPTEDTFLVMKAPNSKIREMTNNCP